jgi:hypothetical protein
MIDLSIINNKTFDIRLNNGTELNIRKPNNEMLKDAYKMANLMQANGEEDKNLDLIYFFLTKMFNRNINDLKFSRQQVENEVDIDVAMYLIKAYQSFITEVIQDINF